MKRDARRNGQRRYRGWTVALSLLAHVAALAAIALVLPRVVSSPPIPARPVNIWLMPRLRRPVQDAVAEASASKGASGKAVQPHARRDAIAPPSPLLSQSPQARSASPAPANEAPTAFGFIPGVDQGVRQALRGAVGCDSGRDLTSEERERCNQRIGEMARQGPAFIDSIPAQKRAYFDAVQQAYKASHDPTHPVVIDANGNIQSWGHPFGLACRSRIHNRPGTSLIDKMKASNMIAAGVGPLSCGLVLPQGSINPEFGIPPP